MSIYSTKALFHKYMYYLRSAIINLSIFNFERKSTFNGEIVVLTAKLIYLLSACTLLLPNMLAGYNLNFKLKQYVQMIKFDP